MQQFLFMLLLGCKPKGRNTEQHDIFFGVGSTLQDLIPEIKAFWPEANGKIHIDAWRKVTAVGSARVVVCERNPEFSLRAPKQENKLFFINLGGYKEYQFDEFHYKMIVVAKDMSQAIAKAKETSFYKHVGFTSANSHIDDKYGLDVDDSSEVIDLLPEEIKNDYLIVINDNVRVDPDEIHLGYMKLDSL
ncbi:MAG TPA: DUF1543 domain-containing protein [Candidatus Paceibacterota bacterium]|nr:DUF1543 domain-containing protein [Candidatus Paceibacterota bacterium]